MWKLVSGSVPDGDCRFCEAIMHSSLIGLLLLSSPVRATPVRPASVDFERHVAPLLAKFGCNAGACHGSFQGKGGLRLSLFGHDPSMDFRALTREGAGRRIDIAFPERSLMLLKATGQVSHEGGRRFGKDSPAADVIRAWIAAGARLKEGGGKVRRLIVTPREHVFARAGQEIGLRAKVEFADGTSEDLTQFCDFRAKDDAIAEVTSSGVVRGLRPGDTPIIIAYRGELTTVRVFIPAEGSSGPPTDLPSANFIDTEVSAKLRSLRLPLSDLTGDDEFLRRVTIDAIGSLPAPDEVRRFRADARPDKRSRKIDELLTHPLHASLWATRLCDVTGCSIDTMYGPDDLRAKQAKAWHDWFRVRIAANEPYDRIVRGVLCANSREGREVEQWIRSEADQAQMLSKGFESTYASRATLDLFWRRQAGDEFFPVEQMAERCATAFLGVRIECAQCHKHPYDRWTRADYRAFANVFSQVQYGSSPETTTAVVSYLERRRQANENSSPPLPRIQEVYVSSHALRTLPDPESGGYLSARAPGGPEIPLKGDARERLFQWLRSSDNPFFARAFVNRVWAHYLGTGLVEPVDNFSVANPPSNERLLDALADDFIRHGYDLRRLERLILESRTYQLSSVPKGANAGDRTNYSHARARPMLAEVVVDVLNDALGSHDDPAPDAPSSARAIEVAPDRLNAPYLARIFRVFGRAPRTAICDCGRATDPTLPQSLFLMTDTVLLRKLQTGRLEKLLAREKSDDALVDELFLAALSRTPDDKERKAALKYVRWSFDRSAAWADVFWAILNTREFILNH
jgi:hypothetical protein